MPAPKPLTETPAPNLDWSREGTPAASDFDDIYFSTDGGLEETAAVFLQGCGLPGAWHGCPCFVIGELGFGTGLNFLSAWRLWKSAGSTSQRLHFVSIEKFPLDKAQLTRALKAWPELEGYSNQLIDQWPGRVKGFHRLEFGNVTLTLIHDDVEPALDDLRGRVNAWFLDGFSPSKNPAMWSPEIMKKIAALSAPGARLATFSVAGFVREGLREAGFDVSKKDGFGRKRHRLEAVFPGQSKSDAVTIRPVIIGAGIGGCSLVRAFLKRGINPVLIDAMDGTAASGNPAAIVKPRLDLQDRPETRFFLSSYLYALQVYQSGGVVSQIGVKQIAKSEDEQGRFRKLAAQSALPVEHMAETAAGLNFPGAIVIDPAKARTAFINDIPTIQGRVGAIQTGEDGHLIIRDESGADHARGSHVFVCMGAGIRMFQKEWDLPTRYSRGQLSWGRGEVSHTLTYGGYAIPMGGDILLGATHERLDDQDPYALREESDQSNFASFEKHVGTRITPISRSGRASVRVNMPDTLPRVLKDAHNVHIMTGLGSRGFVFAPLLAEAAVSDVIGDPLPLPKTLWARFQAREKPNLRARP